jgi:hypothetical protein
MHGEVYFPKSKISLKGIWLGDVVDDNDLAELEDGTFIEWAEDDE